MTKEELRKHCERTCDRYREAHYKGFNTAYEEHKLILDLLNQTEWIPVTERLPEKDGRYLCSYENEFGTCVDFGKFEKNDWWVGRVTAWMPLPEPWKGDEE